MKKLSVVIVSLLLALMFISADAATGTSSGGIDPSAFVVSSQAVPFNVIVIGWDGAQREHTYDLLEAGRLPNLERLAKDGALTDIYIYENTATKAGWAQILTGYNAAVTGVHTNSKYQPIPKGYSIFERLEERYGVDNIATLAVIGKLNNVGCAAPKLVPVSDLDKIKNTKRRKKMQRQFKAEGELVEKDGIKYYSIPGEPWYTVKDSMDLFENGLHENDKVGARALEVLDEYAAKPFFYFIHFADVDSQGHKFGENSDEYSAAIENSDKWLGRIRYELKKLGIADRTLVYLTSDHGFDEGLKSHKDAPFVFLATNDKTVYMQNSLDIVGNPRLSSLESTSTRNAAATRADITPTILERYGFDLTAIEPALNGVALDQRLFTS